MRLLFGSLVVAALLLFGASARAEEPPLETADGADNCRALRAQNDTDIHLYEQRQPATPYKYPQPNLVINSPLGEFFHGIGQTPTGLVLSSILPALGAQYRGGSPAIVVTWPTTLLLFGPMYACTRVPGSYAVDGHRVHRVLLEPTLVSSKFGTGFSIRPGYRFIWHPTSWVVGPGIGLGSTIEITGNSEPFRYSLSPELVGHFGNCCSANYFTLTARYDHYFKGTNNDIIGGTLGYTFF